MTNSGVEVIEFGSLLRQYRKRARLTQNELADLALVSLRTIRNLESGRTASPRPETIRLLANGLGLTAESQARLSLAVGQSPVSATLAAAQGWLPSPGGELRTNPIGRDDDMRPVLEAFRVGDHRVISISGFGGVGKTRLASAVAREVERTLRTPWIWLRAKEPWVPMIGSQTDGVFTRWHRELIEGHPDAAEELARLIGERAFLIIVDDAQGEDSPLDAALLRVIERCPRLLIIETTRRPRKHDGRLIMPLKPLPVPLRDPAILRRPLDYHVLQFFLPLVRAAQPDFPETQDNLRLVLDVCRWLDGLPRALAAAAPWFAFYPPAWVAQAAREDPAMLAASPGGETPENWLLEALDDALNGLTERQCDLLFELAARPAPWTVKELVAESRSASSGLVESVHTLLLLGLIRSADVGSVEQAFTVLNVLRRALLGQPGPGRVSPVSPC